MSRLEAIALDFPALLLKATDFVILGTLDNVFRGVCSCNVEVVSW